MAEDRKPSCTDFLHLLELSSRERAATKDGCELGRDYRNARSSKEKEQELGSLWGPVTVTSKNYVNHLPTPSQGPQRPQL